MPVCEWPVAYGDCGPCTALNEATAETKALVEAMATDYLWRWTGQRFGVCSSTIRPCRQLNTAGFSTYGRASTLDVRTPWTPVLLGGDWVNIGCGGCGDSCGCDYGSVLRFEKPVAEVTSVRVDGVTLDPSAYRLDDGVLLVRQDGGRWPYCQDMSRPAGQEDTWDVTVSTGTPVPAGGQTAAGKLACEFARALCGDKGCELPQRWQSITRQGVSISAAIDLFQGLDEGKTGIWLIDSWVASIMKPDIGFSIASPNLRPVGRRA